MRKNRQLNYLLKLVFLCNNFIHYTKCMTLKDNSVIIYCKNVPPSQIISAVDREEDFQ